MDIALKLKRAVAVLATGVIFASTAGVALAQTFNDVATDAWYYDYVEQLVSDGVIDSADNYRPADALNRAELTKIAITAIDGLAGYTAPATPTFDDVPADAWFFDYVEAAVQLGIVNGYSDANGNLTGKFGPSDTVNRAAATKILVNAFSVPTDLDPASTFPDVKSADWFYDYVTTAYNQSIVDGYDNGYFGPADPITRAQVAKLVVLSQNPVERVVSGEGEGEGEGEPATSNGDLEVSLNDNTPASSTLPLNANGVALASFDFTADQDAVYVSNLVVTRGGVGKADDWDNVYLYDGATRLTTGRTVNNDTNTATFPLKLTVDAGTTTTLTLVGDVSATAGASNQHYFYIASAANVTTNALSVAGDFPVAGNTFTMGGAGTAVNTITVAPGTAPAKVTIGQQDAEIASIKVTAGATNDVAVHQLAVTNGGTLSSDKIVNLRLLRGTDEVATTDGFIGDVATFVLDTPYLVPKGQTKTFYVHGDIDGGRSTDNVILYLDEDTDIIAVDQQYGFGANVANNFGQAAANVVTLEGGDVTVVDNGPAATQIARNSTNVELSNFSITTARDLTVRDTFIQLNIQDTAGAGPTLPPVLVAGVGSTTIAAVGAALDDTSSFCITDATRGGIAAGDMLQITAASGTVYAVAATVTGSDAVNCSGTDTYIKTTLAAGDMVTLGAAKATEVDPYDYVKNLKLVDLDSGSTLTGPSTDANSGATCVDTLGAACPGVAPDSYNKVYTEDYEFTGGETRHLSIQADIDQNMAAGYQISAAVQYADANPLVTSSYIKDLAANEFVAKSAIIGAGATPLTGNFMITAENSLTVSRATTPTSQEYVKGDTSVPSLGVGLKAGDAGDITLKRLSVRVYGDDGLGGVTTPNDPFDFADAPGVRSLGNVAANTLVSSVTLYDGNDVVAGPKSISLVDAAGGTYTAGVDYYRAQFDDINMVIKAGQTKTLTAKLNLLNSATARMWLAVDLVPNTDIIAEDSDANTITANGAALNNSAVLQHNPLLTIQKSGSLTASSEGNPDKDILVSGATDQLVAKYRFHSLKEDFNVKKLTIVNDMAVDFGDVGAGTSAVASIYLKFPDVNGVMQTSTTSSLDGATGAAKFAGLDFYVPAGEDAFLEVYANVNTKAAVGEIISGKSLRLGLQNWGNDITTFEAIGQSSSTNLNFDTVAGVKNAVPGLTDLVSNSASVNPFVVRNSVPTFALINSSTSLTNSENTLFKFSVTADSAGSVSFGRLVFNVDMSDDAGADLDLNNFKFTRGTGGHITGANIWSGLGVNLIGAGAIGNVGDDVIVSFDQEETVDAGSTVQYSLKATGVNTFSRDSVVTSLNTSDETTELAGLTMNTNPNTGRVYAAADATNGIFTAAAADFSKLLGVNRNIIWSDKSADAHAYPTVAAGVVTTVTGSFDWTNGYLLKATDLNSQSLTK